MRYWIEPQWLVSQPPVRAGNKLPQTMDLHNSKCQAPLPITSLWIPAGIEPFNVFNNDLHDRRELSQELAGDSALITWRGMYEGTLVGWREGLTETSRSSAVTNAVPSIWGRITPW